MTNDDKCVMCCGDVGTSATNFFMEVSRINQDAYVEQYLQTGTGNRKVKSGSIVIRRLFQNGPKTDGRIYTYTFISKENGYKCVNVYIHT